MRYTLSLALLATVMSTAVFSQTQRRLITESINETRLHRLAGNTRSEANSANDQGRVADSLPMEHMQLLLRRSADRQAALDTLVQQQHDKNSRLYHHWLTAAEFGDAYGPAQEDVTAVTGWLTSHGFTVNSVSSSGMLVDFSGTAAEIRNAFHTEIHNLNVNGTAHIANMGDPQIPDALAAAVRGVVSMHDFRPRPMKRERAKYTFNASGSTYQAVTPGDLATIYNLNPLFAAGITGKGQTIAVIEDTDLYTSADWTTFRNKFGLSAYTSGSLATVHPASANTSRNSPTSCSDPGVPSGGDDGEAILDAEWASAAAPDAAIQVASCADTRTTFGGFIALTNMVNSSNPPSIVSISYGECEAENGASSNAAFNALYQQAAAEGVSVFVSAGDEGAASCDAGGSGATHGIGVSAFASTPYNVAVGGTDFSDTFHNTNSTYWSDTNSDTYASALSYVPEVPWDDSCASGLLSSYFGFSSPYGSSGFCASSTASQDQLLGVVAGSGGPSGCATGSPSTTGVAKPDWQAALPGIPNDNVRDIPDISLFAATGVNGHYYVFCWSNKRAGGATCGANPSDWAGAGGTTFASPILAGVQALVNQNAGGAQGNPNPVYYNMAAIHGTCNSSDGNAADSSCIFYNITEGDNSVNCSGTTGCFGATAAPVSNGRHHASAPADGALSLSNGDYAPAYQATRGWNFATGIGSINAYNLVMNWNQ
jgi:subtilase family serine protease